MNLTAFALLTFSLSIFLTVKSQHVPKTCQCPKVLTRVQIPFSDFTVNPKGPTCFKDEIIVTLQKDKRLVCLSPDGKQGKRLMTCWQKNGKNSTRCLRRQKQRQNKRRQAKSKKGIS
ncbi:uncharacterized protein LOC130431683 [Triplophysa dalaica]|uniref:uncharacterized protein LOC130431683 n=1 Tax=Triplophysa dalaica TaxID=1582913 RepID=UPI0024DFB896|nr:uncharacterized protein LOC130431683 [Triplophysa dalaica]XP_056616820.1 uncharacterized protein LOC130431683 [Triplophysa dalaica]XP_056616821.1 uncharacterized protein LOC130431683 [Triplophysa dalaica]XP_056616822.1 uncharacterized protein LOC130431683 [Triplophysa dalaica]